MNSTLDQIGGYGIVPVAVINDPAAALPLARALLAGGLPCIEVTFRTAAAAAAIATIARDCPDLLLGAGTVLSVEQVDRALECGARFIVAPGLNRKVVEYCLKRSVPVAPGVLTPSEMEAALDLGLEVVKFFPAEASGGLKYLKAVSAPYKGLRFIPTGGIDESNLSSYLSFPAVLACGGSWMVSASLVDGKRFGEITALSARATALVRAARPAATVPAR
ncbi:MAG TPA: bifunctional 4-hydroxy-2-oxoglutarate aldolase/2-dehydro-3-deoxy-phosphogluconate aldolase [Bacteroidota bacterium]